VALPVRTRFPFLRRSRSHGSSWSRQRRLHFKRMASVTLPGVNTLTSAGNDVATGASISSFTAFPFPDLLPLTTLPFVGANPLTTMTVLQVISFLNPCVNRK